MRGFLLDADALLDTRPLRRPSSGTQAFLQRALRERWVVCVSAVSLGAVGRRLARLQRADGREAHAQLWRWLERVFAWHPQAVLPFDGRMAVTAAHLQALHGTSLLRAQVVACALVHELAIVTPRPERYDGLGVALWPLWSLKSPVHRNSAEARQVCRPLGPVPGLATRPSRLRWGYQRGVAPGVGAR